jgi:hypothetical protein
MHSAGEHRPLLAAITAGDRATAETLMRQHLAHVPETGPRPRRHGDQRAARSSARASATFTSVRREPCPGPGRTQTSSLRVARGPLPPTAGTQTGPPRGGWSRPPGCASAGDCQPTQQGTTRMAWPDASTRARISSGSLVAIRSPALAIATTVASTASPLPARPKRTPAPWPRERSTALTSTERSSRDNEACRPEASRHTWAKTAPLLRSSRPPRSAARKRATISRSARSTAKKAPASRTSALKRPAPSATRGAGPSRR